MQEQEDTRIIKVDEVQKLTSLSRSTIWRLENTGKFPKKVRLSQKSIGWLESDIQTWIKTRKSKTMEVHNESSK